MAVSAAFVDWVDENALDASNLTRGMTVVSSSMRNHLSRSRLSTRKDPEPGPTMLLYSDDGERER